MTLLLACSDDPNPSDLPQSMATITGTVGDDVVGGRGEASLTEVTSTDDSCTPWTKFTLSTESFVLWLPFAGTEPTDVDMVNPIVDPYGPYSWWTDESGDVWGTHAGTGTITIDDEGGTAMLTMSGLDVCKLHSWEDLADDESTPCSHDVTANVSVDWDAIVYRTTQTYGESDASGMCIDGR